MFLLVGLLVSKPRNTHTQPRWAGTRRDIHPLTPIVVISHPLSASSIYYDPWHPPCSIYVPEINLVNLSEWVVALLDTLFFCAVLVKNERQSNNLKLLSEAQKFETVNVNLTAISVGQ